MAVAHQAGRRARSGLDAHPVARFVARRLALGCASLFVASIVIFVATHLLPGDVVGAVLGRGARPETVARLRAELGLDDSLLQQYLTWLQGFLTGDWGHSSASLATGGTTPVQDLVIQRAENTIILAGITFAILVPLSLLIGVITAARSGRPVDSVLTTGSLVAVSLPEFVVGTLLVFVFFLQFDLLPPVSLVAPGSSPLAEPKVLVLPVLTLLLTSVAWTARLVRASMLDALQSEYVQMARLSGFPERRVVWRVALRNAMAPSVQVFALVLQYMLGGIILTEAVFSYPGLGTQLVGAVLIRDIPTVQTISMLLAIAFVLVNIVADLVVVLLVPKLRTAL